MVPGGTIFSQPHYGRKQHGQRPLWIFFDPSVSAVIFMFADLTGGNNVKLLVGVIFLFNSMTHS